MSERKKVLVVGDVNVDLIVNFPKMLPDSTVQYPEPEMSGGGTCGNTLAALCNLGVETAFMGTVGDDAYGRSLMNDMKAAGVDVSALITDPELNTVAFSPLLMKKGNGTSGVGPVRSSRFSTLTGTRLVGRLCGKLAGYIVPE